MTENIIYIGNKPIMKYVLAVVTQFNNDVNEIILKARGKSINRAVDVAEVVRNKFIKDLVVDDISISTDSMVNDDGSEVNVSVIEIKLQKVN